MTTPAWVKTIPGFASGWLRDVVSRMAKTFVQAFIGQLSLASIVGVQKVVLLSNLDRAAISGAASVGALAIGVLARWSSSDKANAAFTGPATNTAPAAPVAAVAPAK